MDVLRRESKKFGIDLTSTQLEKFEIYMNFLLEYNKHTNLTAIKTPEDVAIKHFLDSIILEKFLNIKTGCKIIDIGTGAGFPGVPLKILRDDIELTLVDSLNKRIIFLNELKEKLNIKINIFHDRAEEIGFKDEFREKFDFVVSRAVAPLNILSEYCLPLVKIEGFFVAMKGLNVSDEINSSKKAISVLGGKFFECYKFELPLNKGCRNIVAIEKSRNTPKNYPRSNSQISKNPL